MAHVLLIDDDFDFVEATKMVLESHGHEVSIAYSAEEGWRELDKGAPDAILLDVMMEEFDAGFALAQDINIKFPRVPVIMLTAVHDFMSDKWQFTPEGDKDWLPAHYFLEKPVSPDALLETIDKAVEATQA